MCMEKTYKNDFNKEIKKYVAKKIIKFFSYFGIGNGSGFRRPWCLKSTNQIFCFIIPPRGETEDFKKCSLQVRGVICLFGPQNAFVRYFIYRLA